MEDDLGRGIPAHVGTRHAHRRACGLEIGGRVVDCAEVGDERAARIVETALERFAEVNAQTREELRGTAGKTGLCLFDLLDRPAMDVRERTPAVVDLGPRRR
jgi:hypothetical protein